MLTCPALVDPCRQATSGSPLARRVVVGALFGYGVFFVLFRLARDAHARRKLVGLSGERTNFSAEHYMSFRSIQSESVDDLAASQTRGKTFAGLRLDALRNAHLFLAASFVFLLPNALFAAALRPIPAAAVLAGCAGALALLWREIRNSRLLDAPVDGLLLTSSLAAGLALCLLGGEGHFFYSNTDWLIRDAVLADLVRVGPKALYRYEEQSYLLRAPLGMYLAPAAVGRMFGLQAAHLALLAQNSLIVGAIGYFATALAQVRKAPFIFVLTAFSGLDILAVFAAEAVEMSKGGAFMAFTHIEWWSTYFSPIPLQYSSFITQLFWVPNHMAPGLWFATLVLLHVRGEIAFSTLLLSCAPLLLWSPLAMMGAIPFVAFLALRLPLRQLAATEIFLATAAGLCFLPIVFYLAVDAGAVKHEWLIFRENFVRTYVTFLLVEIPQAAIVLYAWRKTAVPDRGPLALALALLLLIPFYSIGPGNDFAMRASIPALFFLAFSFARIAVLTPRDDSAFPTLIASLVLIGAGTPLIELRSAVSGRYQISDCNLLTAWSKELQPLPTNYLARVEKSPDWLIRLDDAPAPLTLEARKCWPDHPYLMDRMK